MVATYTTWEGSFVRDETGESQITSHAKSLAELRCIIMLMSESIANQCAEVHTGGAVDRVSRTSVHTHYHCIPSECATFAHCSHVRRCYHGLLTHYSSLHASLAEPASRATQDHLPQGSRPSPRRVRVDWAAHLSSYPASRALPLRSAFPLLLHSQTLQIGPNGSIPPFDQTKIGLL